MADFVTIRCRRCGVVRSIPDGAHVFSGQVCSCPVCQTLERYDIIEEKSMFDEIKETIEKIEIEVEKLSEQVDDEHFEERYVKLKADLNRGLARFEEIVRAVNKVVE